jgi:hypothetical protein
MQITTDSIKDQIPYYLTQEDKGHLVNALNSFPRVDYYLNRYPQELLQGDGWTSLEVMRLEDNERKLVKGILLSNSCDIDIANKRDLPSRLIFSPIIRLSRYKALLLGNIQDANKVENKITAIKEQKVTALFYLPKGTTLDDDYVAILDDVHTISVNRYMAQNSKQKLFTLSQVGFYLFLLKLSVHFCRFQENIERR